MIAPIGVLCLLLSQGPSESGRAVEVELTPMGDPQIAVWLEDSNGRYVSTLMVTRLTGTFGLANRPGRGDFGGGYLWPYGKREMVLPVWAHKRGVEYDRLVFQDCKESWLGWHESTSSPEPFFCRPLTASEMSVDTITCPTTRFNTDKGIPLRLVQPGDAADCPSVLNNLNKTTFYPPRNDVALRDATRDWDGVMMLKDMNELDAISRATPREGVRYRIGYRLPDGLADGTYSIWVEVNQEYDVNAYHRYDFFVDPALRDYGIPHIGQPSVLWKVPFTVTASPSESNGQNFVGYGAPDGFDGLVRPPDTTITTGVSGSGEGRLATSVDQTGEYRVKVRYSPDSACNNPPPVVDLAFVGSDWQFVEVRFTADTTGEVRRYEVRYLEGKDSIRSLEDYERASPGPDIGAFGPGQAELIQLTMPRPETAYTVGIRGFNTCGRASEFMTVGVATGIREFATVDACFIATAAFGDKDAEDVRTLRRFRDQQLTQNEPGRAFIAAYYRVSPPFAALIARSDLLRAATRGALAPFVWIARALE